MGLLVEGVWHDKWYDTKESGGRFVRQDSKFRDWVTKDGKPLLVKGSTLTAVVIARLKELQITKLYSGEINVIVPAPQIEQNAA